MNFLVILLFTTIVRAEKIPEDFKIFSTQTGLIANGEIKFSKVGSEDFGIPLIESKKLANGSYKHTFEKRFNLRLNSSEYKCAVTRIVRNNEETAVDTTLAPNEAWKYQLQIVNKVNFGFELMKGEFKIFIACGATDSQKDNKNMTLKQLSEALKRNHIDLESAHSTGVKVERIDYKPEVKKKKSSIST